VVKPSVLFVLCVKTIAAQQHHTYRLFAIQLFCCGFGVFVRWLVSFLGFEPQTTL
jgi:hypothetical protein|tara:strand:+ start:31 stop:195 length:165 start_codon:yes stop_codon:yes gene_type:complete